MIGFKSLVRMVKKGYNDVAVSLKPLSTLGNKSIKWLGEEALRRYLKLKPPSYVPNRQEVVADIRKTVGGAICDPEDAIKAVLDDNDFVSIGKYDAFLVHKIYHVHCIVLETDRPNPALTQAEIKYVPEQM